MGLKSVRATDAEALSLATIKTHLREAGSDFDAEIASLASAALDMVETETGRAIVTQTVTLTLDRFPCQIRLPRAPLASLTSITYLDTSGVSQTLASSVYRVSPASEPAVISLARDESWPATDPVQDAVTVTYVAGYGDAESEIPAGLRQAMLLLIGHWFDNREVMAAGSMREMPLGAARIINNWKLGWHAAADSLSQAVV